MKSVQGEIIQRKMSGGGGDSMGANFQSGDYRPEGNYLGVILGGELFLGQLFRGNCAGRKNPGVISLGGIS